MNRIIETCKSGSDHSFPDSAASKPPQNFLYQPPSLSSLWMWQKQRLTLTIEIPNAHLVVLSSGCVLQSMSIQVFEQNPKLKKKTFLFAIYCIRKSEQSSAQIFFSILTRTFDVWVRGKTLSQSCLFKSDVFWNALPAAFSIWKFYRTGCTWMAPLHCEPPCVFVRNKIERWRSHTGYTCGAFHMYVSSLYVFSEHVLWNRNTHMLCT